MTAVSDVFAFAAEHADYWKDLLSGGDYPQELTDDERRALDAASKHIEALVVELLHECGAAFTSSMGPRWTLPNFKRAATATNRRIVIPPPDDLKADLYRVEFVLSSNDEGNAVVLWPVLAVKKRESQPRLVGKLTERSVKHVVRDYWIYGAAVPIVAGQELSDLASRAARIALELLVGCELHDPAAA